MHGPQFYVKCQWILVPGWVCRFEKLYYEGYQKGGIWVLYNSCRSGRVGRLLNDIGCMFCSTGACMLTVGGGFWCCICGGGGATWWCVCTCCSGGTTCWFIPGGWAIPPIGTMLGLLSAGIVACLVFFCSRPSRLWRSMWRRMLHCCANWRPHTWNVHK